MTRKIVRYWKASGQWRVWEVNEDGRLRKLYSAKTEERAQAWLDANPA